MPAGRHSSGKKRPARAAGPGSLNEDQARRLRITCQHIDLTLSEIENILDEAASGKAFLSYIQDFSPDQKQMIEDCSNRVRERLVAVLEEEGILLDGPEIPVSRAIHGRLYSIDNAAEEIRAKHMRGYGGVSQTSAKTLDIFADDLQGLVGDLDRALKKECRQDL